MVISPVRLVREGLAASLRGRPGIDLVDAVSFDAPGLARIARAAPSIILIDIAGLEVAATAHALKSACPGAKLVAFALAEIDDAVFACAAAGFSAYVPRESGSDDLYRALVDAAGGHMRCAPHIAAAMFQRLAHLLNERDAVSVLPSLTSRESEILTQIERGASNKEIARRLSISCATVKNHLHNIFQKLQVTRRGQAAARLRRSAEGEPGQP